MTRYAAVALCALVLAGFAPAPCPEGKARDNGGQCVATANVFDQFDKPAPSKDEYIASHDPVAEFNREQEAKSEARRAREDSEWAADRRADRLVEAERETQAKLDRIGDKLD